jgi:hypothetical protein
VTELLRLFRGNMAAVARAYGVSRPTVWEFVWRHNLRGVREEARWAKRQDELDRAEGKLQAKIKAGDLRAIMYFLDRQGRDRGYGKPPEQPAGRAGSGQPFRSGQRIRITLEEYRRLPASERDRLGREALLVSGPEQVEADRAGSLTREEFEALPLADRLRITLGVMESDRRNA